MITVQAKQLINIPIIQCLWEIAAYSCDKVERVSIAMTPSTIYYIFLVYSENVILWSIWSSYF